MRWLQNASDPLDRVRKTAESELFKTNAVFVYMQLTVQCGAMFCGCKVLCSSTAIIHLQSNKVITTGVMLFIDAHCNHSLLALHA